MRFGLPAGHRVHESIVAGHRVPGRRSRPARGHESIVAGLFVLGGCVASADPIEIAVPNARSAVVVIVPPSGEPKVHAIELAAEDGGRIGVPRSSADSELY